MWARVGAEGDGGHDLSVVQVPLLEQTAERRGQVTLSLFAVWVLWVHFQWGWEPRFEFYSLAACLQKKEILAPPGGDLAGTVCLPYGAVPEMRGGRS